MKKILKLSLILFLVSAIVAGVLGLVDFATRDKIAFINDQKTDAAYHEVMSYDKKTPIKDIKNPAVVKKLFKTNDGNWIAECEVSGSQGLITVAVGVNADLKCNGIAIISSSETSGLGAKASEPEFREQFKGITQDEAKVTKDGGAIQAISGATITSKAVSLAVNSAIAEVSAQG